MTINPHHPAPPLVPTVVEVRVNHRPVPVTCPDRRRTVEAVLVKRSAIAAGVAIAENFQLSVHHDGRYRVLADHVEVELHHGLEFLAVAPDDNS